MSTAFTIDNTNWQELAKINEIQLAYSEHVQALGGGAQANKSEGVDIQSAAFWNAYQNWLEANRGSFIDDTNGPLTVDSSGFLYYTEPAWRAAAGLNASGFRRSTDGVNFSYGTMQDGDIIGDWIFDDLTKGFSALRWTLRNGTGYVDLLSSSICFYGEGVSCDFCRTYVIDYWPSQDWSSVESNAMYRVYAYLYHSKEEYCEWKVIAERYHGKARLRSIPTMQPCSVSIYIILSGTDIDSLGYSTTEYAHLEDLVESSNAERTGALKIGSATTCPLEDFPVICPAESPVSQETVVSNNWVLKWNFTNSD